MGNNETSNIARIGLVTMKLKDETVKLLRNVNYVPKSLLFLVSKMISLLSRRSDHSHLYKSKDNFSRT